MASSLAGGGRTPWNRGVLGAERPQPVLQLQSGRISRKGIGFKLQAGGSKRGYVKSPEANGLSGDQK